MSDAISVSKNDVDHVDNKPHALLPEELPLPGEIAHLDAAEVKKLERKLTRSLDFTLMPAVFILFLLNILDRNNIASAKIVGLPEDLGMANTQYNTCLLMFYVGYCIIQVPGNLIVGKVRPSYYICLITSAWGVMSMSQGFVTNFQGLAGVRFVLGLVEAPFLPAVFVVMSCWYKRTELPPRIAILHGGNMLATAFAGLIAAGITSQMEGVGGKKAWEWLFIIEGGMTVVIAFLVLPLMTDYPLQSKHLFLSRDIQLLAEWRIRKENAGIADEDVESIFWGLKQALLDPKLYMFVVMQMALITSQSFNNFFPSIVGTLGYDNTTTLLLTAPPYFAAFLASLLLSFHAARARERGYHIAAPMVLGLLGNLLAVLLPATAGRYAALFLMTSGTCAPYGLCVSWLSASLPRPRAKRAAALALVNCLAAGVAHFYTSYMFPDAQRPRYYAGGAVMSGACVVVAAAACLLKRYLKGQNARFEREEEGEEEEARGAGGGGGGVVGRHGYIRGAKTGRGRDAIVTFRYVH